LLVRRLEINADKTNYMALSRDQNAVRSHTTKTDNNSFEKVEEIRIFGTNLTNENSIQETIRIRINSAIACYHSVQNLLSSILLSKNMKTGIYRTLILPVVLYGCETWFPTLRDADGV
jgi:hypothetical protein